MAAQVVFDVDINGFDRFMAKFPDETLKAVRRKLSGTVGPRLVRRVRARTRVRTGRLRRSAYQRLVPREPAIDVGYTAPYARFVEGPPIGDDVLGSVAETEGRRVKSDIRAAIREAVKKAGGSRR